MGSGPREVNHPLPFSDDHHRKSSLSLFSVQAGTSRTRVPAIANGNTHGVSTDGLIRVRAATGHRAEIQGKKAAA
jgi:hypothetical protein